MEINNDLNNVPLNNIDKTNKAPLSTSELSSPMQEHIQDYLSEVFISLNEGDNMLADILRLAGFKVTPENIKMIKEMLQNNLPVNKDTLKTFNQAVKLTGGDYDKALFLVKNEMNISAKNTEILNGFSSRETNILSELRTLASIIDELPDPIIKQNIAEMITGKKINIKPTLTDLTGEIKPNLPPSELSETLKSSSVMSEMMDMPEAELADTVNKLIETFPQQKPEIETAANTALQAKQVFEEIKPEIMVKLEIFPGNDKNIDTVREKLDILLKDILGEKEAAFEPVIKEKFLQELNIRTDKNLSVRDKIMSKFLFKPDKEDKDVIDKLLNNLKDKLQSVKAELVKQNAAEPKVFDSADKIIKNVQFLNEMKTSTFIQIPMLLGDKEVNAELYVFKDKRQKKGGSSGSSSALLSLDLSNLGHVEAYIKKDSQNVMCQFRVSSEAAGDIVKSNIGRLEEKLTAHGYALSGVFFKNTGEPFTLLDEEPVLTGESSITNKDFKIGLDVRT